MIDTSKLQLPLSDTKTNMVLFYNGCFNPIHQNHVRLLELTREHLLSLDTYHIVGAYVCPSHDAGIERKLSIVQSTWEDRLEMCRLAVTDSSWIMIDHWQISQEKNPGAQQSKQRLTDLLRKSHPSLMVVSVCGGDALPKFKSTFKKELVICVVNRPIDDFDFNPWYESPAIEAFHSNIILIRDNQTTRHISSTSIRQRISQNQYHLLVEDLHPAVLEYHRQKGITYRSVNETVSWTDFDPSSEIEIGQGRCATVYAKHYQNQQVAVKVIRERKQFENESKVLLVLNQAQFYHPNVIKILGIGNQFCVMEKCDLDLLSYLNTHRFNSDQTLETAFPNLQWTEWITQMLNGFVHLASLGILHRDIKTDNILLLNSIVKIADFSVSVNLHNMSKMPVRGSIRHSAPEVIEDKNNHTEKSDVYMFGCLLYEIVHGGERLWSDKNTPEVVRRRSNGEKPIFSAPCESWYMNMVIDECWNIIADQRSSFQQILTQTFSVKMMIV